MDIKRAIGSPWTLMSVPDFLVIGLMAIIAMQLVTIGGFSLARLNYWRATGNPAGASQQAGQVIAY